LGGFHGFVAFHGLTGDCGCFAFEEHQHYITPFLVGGADARGMAFTPEGDVWEGDRDFVSLLPQRSLGANTGLFDANFTVGLDVFPGVRDEVTALAVDSAGGVYVASGENGLAYLAPVTYAPTFWSSATTLPQNHLTAAAIDGAGDVWIGTDRGGVARFRPSTSGWTYYTAASGLPSNRIRAIYFDRLTTSGRLWIATDNGVAAY
jgi:streptogramin lyase